MLDVLTRQKIDGLPLPKLFSGRATIGQPLLTLQAPVDSDAPWFDLDCPADLTAGDQIEVQYGTAADFAGATSVVTTLTTQQASYGVLDLNRSALTNATTYYFRARYVYANSIAGREKRTGPWSRTQSYTVATVSVPSTPTLVSTNTKICGYADPNSNFNLNSLQGRDFDLGQPDAGRNIIIAGGGTMTSTTVAAYANTDKNIAAGDYLGTALTERIKNTFSASRTSAIYSGVVAAGRSGRISVHMGTGFNISFGVLRAYGLSSATPSPTDKTDSSTPADPFNIGSSFTMPSGGFAIAVVICGGTFASRAWQNSFSEALAYRVIDNTMYVSIAVRTASGSTQAAINRGNFQTTSGTVAAWN